MQRLPALRTKGLHDLLEQSLGTHQSSEPLSNLQQCRFALEHRQAAHGIHLLSVCIQRSHSSHKVIHSVTIRKVQHRRIVDEGLVVQSVSDGNAASRPGVENLLGHIARVDIIFKADAEAVLA